MDINTYLNRLGFPILDESIIKVFKSDTSNLEKSKSLARWFHANKIQVYTRTYGDNILLSYPHSHTGSKNKVIEFNGVIIDSTTLKVVSIPLRNLQPGYVSPASVNSGKVYYAVDGTLFNMYYSKDDDDKTIDGWVIHTAHTANAYYVRMLESTKLIDIVQYVFKINNIDVNSFDKATNYTFMMQHPQWNLTYTEKEPSITFISQTIISKDVLFNYDAPVYLRNLKMLKPYEFTQEYTNVDGKIGEIMQVIKDRNLDRSFYGFYIINAFGILTTGMTNKKNIHNHHMENTVIHIIRKFVYTPMYTYNTLPDLALYIYLRTNATEYNIIKLACPILAPYLRVYMTIFGKVFNKLKLSIYDYELNKQTTRMSMLVTSELTSDTKDLEIENAAHTIVDAIYADVEDRKLLNESGNLKDQVITTIMGELNKYSKIYMQILPKIAGKIVG